jgi:hypothetical protein
MRFDDMAQCAEQYQGRNTPFLGMVTGDRALNEVFSYMGRMDTSRPLALVDVGKLRTLYLGGFLGRPLFIHAIPVGLARDDQHYFTSITPTLAHLDAIDRQLGTLLFPPDATPSPVFDPLISTPQVDCTRFSMQVARYADRTRRDLLGMTGGSNSVFYVTGRASRLPGFRRYLESKTSVRFRRLDRRPVDGIHLEGNVTWPDVSDHLLPIGAALAYHRREATRQGLVLRDRRPENLVTADIDPLSLTPGNLYVIGSPSRGDSQRFSSASAIEREALSEG